MAKKWSKKGEKIEEKWRVKWRAKEGKSGEKGRINTGFFGRKGSVLSLPL
ncbi:MAG: hypothetical protein WC142_01290 [Bacteroidales bacterium]|jgi:hypothetical protein|nr:hypothetical protein [Bacteroidales bacterium]NLO42898.1 hypothetical protein [Bacteroidales bacterium]